MRSAAVALPLRPFTAVRHCIDADPRSPHRGILLAPALLYHDPVGRAHRVCPMFIATPVAGGSTSGTERICQIDQLLGSRRFVTRRERLDRLGVSWATLKRDVAYLKDCLHVRA